MRTGSGGFVLVLGDRHTAWAGVHVRVSRFRGAAWLARARRLLRHGRRLPPALRLISSHYVDDPARAHTQLAAMLGPRFAQRGRARQGRLRKALAEILAEDRARLEARFAPETGLFRTPGDALPLPAKRLVARLGAETVAHTPGRRRTLPGQLRRPYALGLLWPLLGARLEAAAVPGIYRPEVYRALVRALAGCHFTDAEMAEVLDTVTAQPAEYRIGAREYERFARRGFADKEAGGAGLDRFAFYLLEPRDHILRGIADYRRRVHGALPVLMAIGAFRMLQIAALGASAAAVAWLVLMAEGGLMPGLTLLFAVGAAIPAGRLYRRPDMARLMGHVSERDLETARAAMGGVHPHTLEPVRPAPQRQRPPAERAPSTAIPLPHGVESTVPQPAGVSPAAPARAVKGKETATSRPAPPANMADVAKAYIATPIGPIPFPVPRMPGEGSPGPVTRERMASRGTDDDTTKSDGRMVPCDSFTLGWGMPIPVPNWMAAIAPETAAESQAKLPPPPPIRMRTESRNPAEPSHQPTVFHAPPLPPVLPSPAFWGVDGTGLHTGPGARPGDGDGSRRRRS